MTIHIQPHLLYTTSHLWIHYDDSKIATVGLTDFAQKQLGEITFIDLPQLGQTLAKNENFGCVESMKAATDLFCPIQGVVCRINEDLTFSPNLINSDPYGKGWLFQLNGIETNELQQLLTADAYSQRI